MTAPLTRVSAVLAALLLLVSAAPPATRSKPAAARAVTPAAAAADLATLRRASERYRDATAYELRGAMVMRVAGASGQTVEAPFIIAYEKPGRLHDELRSPNGAMTVMSDGHSRYEYLGQLQQYRRHTHPIRDESVAAGTAGGSLGFGTGLVRLFADAADSALSVRRLADAELTLEGAVRPCVVLEVTSRIAPPPGTAAESPRTYWIDREDHRILRVQSTLTRQGPQGTMRVEQDTRFDRVRLGGPLPDSLFAFTPPPGAKLVREWEVPGQPKRADLTGQAANDFELTDLAGRKHRLSEHKGSVVLIDFWATWCGPCRITMPLVDKLEREYEARGLVVYSINLRETQDAAAGYIRKKGYHVTTLLDPDGKIGDAYQVVSIPSLFIIGKDGKVAAQMVGVQQEEDLREAIEDAGL